MGRDLYRIFVRGEILLTDATTAEMVKLMENTYRDVNIAIANEFSRLADRLGIDVWETIEIANRHPRVDILRPGPGVGGHCISVDPWFLVEAAPDLTPLIQAARQVNDGQPAIITGLVRRTLQENGVELKGSKIGMLGLTYKADIDDTRESPAIEICNQLSAAGAVVMAHDPYIETVQYETFSNSRNFEDAIADCDLLVILVPHTPFRSLVPEDLKRMTRARLVVDAVNILDPAEWQQAGIQVRRLGVGK
jgi:UDP-N-acetyl-D-mannosaminuronic acid dehydrogenase